MPNWEDAGILLLLNAAEELEDTPSDAGKFLNPYSPYP